MLLQKSFVVSPIFKELQKNNGEKTQYFVEGNHEGILGRNTYKKVLAERAHGALPINHAAVSYEWNLFPFSIKVHCDKYGKYFTRKTLAAKTHY